ncbi:MAG: hypothetical protein CMJ84_07105 [Planctomycetes bacterium]|nr:hypothetical protein [Planctomycetota bacterium]
MSDQRRFNTWTRYEKKDTSWRVGLPDCSCAIRCIGWYNPDIAVWDGPKNVTFADTFHPGAVKELRSKVPNASGAGQQCTYDELGRLITEKYGGGTEDRKIAPGIRGAIAQSVAEYGHIGHDVNPFKLGYRLDGDTHGSNIDEYLVVRRINQGRGCAPNDGSANNNAGDNGG